MYTSSAICGARLQSLLHNADSSDHTAAWNALAHTKYKIYTVDQVTSEQRKCGNLEFSEVNMNQQTSNGGTNGNIHKNLCTIPNGSETEFFFLRE